MITAPRVSRRPASTPWLVVISAATLAGAGLGPPAPSPDGRSTPDANFTTAEASGQLPITITVENPHQRTLEPALVQGGVAFAAGVLTEPARLALTTPDGSPLDLQARALAFWPNGSVKWAELTYYAPAVAASGRASATLILRGPGDTVSAPAPEAPPLELPGLRLEDEQGTADFVAPHPVVIATGVIAQESAITGSFERREARTSVALSMTRFPRIGAFRYRVALKQLADGGTWKRLSMSLPQVSALVDHAEDLDAQVAPRPGRGVLVTLIHADQAVDRGWGRCWEVWGFQEERPGQPGPLRPFAAPVYTSATGALGDSAAPTGADWDRALEENADRVFAKRAADRHNSGWPNFGAFFDREHGLAYYGYLNGEYDPATALWQVYVRGGSPKCFERAEILSAHFRDMSVAPDGGVYEHRATWNAADAQVIALIAPALEHKLTSQAAYSPRAGGLVTSMRNLYGEPAARASERILRSVAELPFAEQQRAVVLRLAGEIVKSSKDRAIRGLSRLSSEQERHFPIRDLYQIYAASPDLTALGFGDVDTAFRPFFDRYGGSWEDFPAFHVDIHPDPAVRHGGGHSLVEMLVLAYFVTGDESYRATALTVARHHVDDLVPRMVARYENQIGTNTSIDSRDLAWPLINLLSLEELTEGREKDLNARIRDSTHRLAALIMRIPPEAHQGSIHVGVALEALCRFHERSHDKAAADYVIRLARYWAGSQWNAERQAFNLNRGDAMSASTDMNGLLIYGLAYAHDLAPDRALRNRVLETYASLLKVRTDYAKQFAQLYRSSTRAAAIINRWDRR